MYTYVYVYIQCVMACEASSIVTMFRRVLFQATFPNNLGKQNHKPFRWKWFPTSCKNRHLGDGLWHCFIHIGSCLCHFAVRADKKGTSSITNHHNTQSLKNGNIVRS